MDWARARDRCLQILANNSYWFFETYLHICEKITRFLGKNSHMANFSQIYILHFLWNAHASLCQNLVSLILAVGSNTFALSKPLACNEATQFAKTPVSYSWSTTAPCPTAANKDVISVFGQQEKATANSPIKNDFEANLARCQMARCQMARCLARLTSRPKPLFGRRPN